MLNAELKRCLASKDENSYVNKRFLSNTALPSWCIFHDTRLISVQHFLSDRNGAWDTTNNSKWRLAGNAATTSGLRLGRSEVWRRLRHYLRAQSQGHHTIDRLEERGVERGSARRSSFERTREGLRQSDEHWNRFKGNAGETSERRGGARMGFSERIDTILN